jgi:hypothetical protein
MVMIAICSLLIGAVLGTQYRVPVLYPATIFGVVLVAGIAVLKGSPVPTLMIALGTWAICLQLGYLGGLITRYCLEATGLAPQRSLHSTIARN